MKKAFEARSTLAAFVSIAGGEEDGRRIPRFLPGRTSSADTMDARRLIES